MTTSSLQWSEMGEMREPGTLRSDTVVQDTVPQGKIKPLQF